jgi:hypothetical protein
MSSHVLGISSVTARHGSGPAASGGAPLPLRRECSPCGLSAGERAARAATRLGGELHNGTTSAMPEMSGCYAQPDTAPECSRDLSLEQVRGATFLRYARPTSAPKYGVTRCRGYELCRQFAPRTDHYQPARSATSASARPISCAIIVHSQTWIYRLALQREHPEHALMHSSQWLLADESLQPLHSKRELPQCGRPLGREAARAQSLQILR